MSSITHAMLAGAAVRALREWLFQLGQENATIGSMPGGLPDVYHLLDVGRLVEARVVVRPNFHASAILWRSVNGK